MTPLGCAHAGCIEHYIERVILARHDNRSAGRMTSKHMRSISRRDAPMPSECGHTVELRLSSILSGR
jgi:hypothetical protein